MTTQAPEAQAGAAPASPSGGDLWRAARTPVIIAVVVIIAATGLALLQGSATKGRLDPMGADHPGSRALVELLKARGVTVVAARTLADARKAATPDSTVVITRPGYFGPQGLSGLAALPGDRVLVEPTADARTALTPGITMAGPGADGPRDPKCALPAAQRAGNADVSGRLGATAPGAVTCYTDASGAGLAQYRANGRTITALANGAPLTNGSLDARGNAALGLNLLGAHRTVVWVCPLRPQPDSSAADQAKPLLQVLPSPAKLAAVQLFIAVLLVAAWRMRRLGPVVAERLPVVVRASETTEGRAGLYRARRARDRAAEALRSGVLSRVEPLLGLPPDAGPDAVATAVAGRTGRDAADVRALLYGAAPEDDSALVALADRLDTLEREVRQS
ncbi:MAG TPA: DUF4350 domain-containing protein [Streptosporangiaceae bacterium]